MKNQAKNTGKITETASLLAILSLVLAFALTCFFCLFLLNKAGLYDVPWFLAKNKTPDNISKIPSENLLGNLFEASSKTDYGYPQASRETLKTLVASLPLKNAYSIRANVVNINGDTEEKLIFEAAKSGDVYKIIIKEAESGKQLLFAFCDGDEVIVTENDITNAVPADSAHSFFAYSLMPDFSHIGGDSVNIIYTGEDNGEYEIIFDSVSDKTITDVRISMNDGSLLSVKLYNDGYPVMTFETLEYYDVYSENVFSK